MTCIIAVRRYGRGAIAADTLINTDDNVSYEDKIVELPFGYAGFTGGQREAQVVAETWAKHGQRAETMRDAMLLAHLAGVSLHEAPLADNDEFEALLLTSLGRIWRIDSAMGVIDGGTLCAIGSGGAVALGAAAALKKHDRHLTALQLATAAARAAVAHCVSCGGAITVRTV